MQWIENWIIFFFVNWPKSALYSLSAYFLFTGVCKWNWNLSDLETLEKLWNWRSPHNSRIAFSFQVYAAWETDEIIGFELWRNLGLALVCVFVITLILLANIQICLMVLLCVTLTLVSFICQSWWYSALLS